VHAPGTIWITGLSASGKSSLSRALAERLGRGGIGALVVIDGGDFRARLERVYGHGLGDRFAVLRLLAEAAREENLAGRHVIVATISHKREMRAHARARVERILEVYLDCPSSVCAQRDPNGIYARAAAGEYECFPGVTEPYEPSAEADVVLDTAVLTPAAAADRLLPRALAFLRANGRA
jgi:adenylylsulfate kinase